LQLIPNTSPKMKQYRVTIDECTATTYIKKIAAWQPVAGLDKVAEHLDEYGSSWGLASPPAADAIAYYLQPAQQHLLQGGPQFPGLPEARFTIAAYPRTQPDVLHIISIVELGEALPAEQQLRPGATLLQAPLPAELLAGVADTVDFFQLPLADRERAWPQVWKQITTAAGSELIALGWAGMTPAEAMRQIGGRLQRQGIGPEYLYALAEPDLQSLLNLVEHPPGPEEYMSAENEPEEY
jgi:hypothetical protein